MKPFNLKILKADVPQYIEADPEVQKLNQKVKYLETVTDFLDRTLKQISNRTFTIKNAIDWKRFTSVPSNVFKNNHCVSIAKFSPQYCDEIMQKADKLPIADAIQDATKITEPSNVAWIKENQQLYKDLEKTILEHNKSQVRTMI